MNLLNQKQDYQKTEITTIISDKQSQSERFTRSMLEEVNQFLQTVHVDFENFLKKHKREHADIAQKMTNLQETCL